MAKFHPIAFRDHTHFLVEILGESFTPVRDICEAIGVLWSSQYEKTTASTPGLGCKFVFAPTSARGEEKTLCIPVRKLSAWLANVSAATASSETSDNLAYYQEKFDDALWRYWLLLSRSRIGAQPEAVPSGIVVSDCLGVARVQLETAAGILCGVDFAFDAQTRVDMLFSAHAQIQAAALIISKKYSEVLGYAA